MYIKESILDIHNYLVFTGKLYIHENGCSTISEKITYVNLT